MALTPEQRSMRARIAAYAKVAQGRADTASARAGFYSRFVREVDPDGVLAPEERDRRAEAAMKAHMTRLALASSRSRAQKREAASKPAEPPRRE